MAFTRVRGPGITTDDNYRVGIITATKFVGPMEASGDSDFTNISATGIGTIDGVKIGDPSGIVTASSSSGIVTYYGDASKLTGLTAGQIPNLAASKITSGTVATARLGSGTANSSSFLRGDQTWASNTSTIINNNANNRLITGSGTADTLEGESSLTYDGTMLFCTGGTITAERGAIPSVESKNSTTSSYARFYCSQTSGSGGYAAFQKLGTTSTAIGGANATQIWCTGDAPLVIGVNDGERARINSSGHMGLGVTPNANWPTNGDFKALQIGTGIAVFGRGSGDEDRGGISANLYSTGSGWKYLGNGHAGRIYFEDGSLVFNNTGSTANSSGANAAATLVETLRINSNGKVAIGGYGNPNSILDVREEKDGAETQIRLYNTDNGDTTTQTAAFYMSPDSRGAAYTGLRAIKENASFATNAGRDISLTLTTTQNNAQVEAIRINSNGKIGISTETGSGLINTRHAGTNQQVLHVKADLGSSNGRSLNLYTPADDNTQSPFIFQTGNGFLFKCDSEDVFTINHDRTLLINTVSPTNTGDSLTVKRSPSGFSEMSMSVDANTTTSSAANAFIFTKSKHYYWNGLGFQSSHGHIGAIVGKRDSGGGDSDQEIRIEIGGTHINQSEEKTWNFKNNGDLSISDGNLIVAEGHGINFAATDNGGSGTPDELLDDYEEGSFSPEVENLSSGYGSGTFYNRFAKYTKVGNMVTCWIHIQWWGNAVTSGSDNTELTITGFPFEVDGVGYRGTCGGPVVAQSWRYAGSGFNTYNVDSDNVQCGINNSEQIRFFVFKHNSITGTVTQKSINGYNPNIELQFTVRVTAYK